jgi:excisionase family DNA binding protein
MENSLNQIIVTNPDTLRAIVADAVLEALADHKTGQRPELELVSGSTLAARLGLSRTTVHRLRVDGAPCVRVGETYKFSPAKVMAWLEARSQGAPS